MTRKYKTIRFTLVLASTVGIFYLLTKDIEPEKVVVSGIPRQPAALMQVKRLHTRHR